MISIKSQENKDFFKMLFVICLPIISQNFISVFVNFVDTLMVAKLGDTAVAAVGLSGQVFFALHLIILGIASGIAVFMAQYWGKRDLIGLHKSIAFGFLVLIPLVLLVVIMILFNPQGVIRIFSKDTSLVIEGAKYLRLVCISYLPMAISILLAYALRSTDNIKYAFYTTVIALSLNVVLNYFLIFGIGIFPRLGIVGAALATVISRYLQLFILLFLIYKLKMPIAIKSFKSLKIDFSLLRKFVKTSGNVFLNETLFGVGTVLLFKVYGHIGKYVVVATSVSKHIENFVWIFFWSLCAAASVSIGKLIGSKKYDLAQKYAYKFMVVGLILSSFLALVLIALSNPLLSLFDISDSAAITAKLYLFIFAIFITIRGPLKILTGGVLRAGGDTGFVMLWDVIPLWITLITCYVLAVYYNVSLLFIYILALGYELIKVIPTLKRIKSKKWITNLVD